jgi:ribosomal protein L37AE/L43A
MTALPEPPLPTPTIPTCPACQTVLNTHCPSIQCDLWKCRTCEKTMTKDGRLSFQYGTGG